MPRTKLGERRGTAEFWRRLDGFVPVGRTSDQPRMGEGPWAVVQYLSAPVAQAWLIQLLIVTGCRLCARHSPVPCVLSDVVFKVSLHSGHLNPVDTSKTESREHT